MYFEVFEFWAHDHANSWKGGASRQLYSWIHTKLPFFCGRHVRKARKKDGGHGLFCNFPTTWGSKKNRCGCTLGHPPQHKRFTYFCPFQRPPPASEMIGRSNGPTDILGRWINSACGWFLFPERTVHFHHEINDRHFCSSRVLLDVFPWKMDRWTLKSAWLFWWFSVFPLGIFWGSPC